MNLPRLIAMSMLAHITFVATRMAGSLYALAHHASTFTVGVQMALFALVPMLTAVRAGRWLDAVGARRPMLVGALMILVGALLPALFPFAVADIAPLLVAAPLVGTGLMLVQLTAQNLVGEHSSPANRAQAFSWLALGYSVTGFSGPVVTGLVIDNFGHRAAFLVFALVALGALAFLRALWQDLPTRHAAPLSTAPAATLDLLRDPHLRSIMFVTVLLSSAWDLQTLMIPVHGTRVGLDPAEIGFVMGSFALATFAVRLAMARLPHAFGEWQVLIFALIAAGLAYALLPWLQGFWPLAACVFLLGFGLGAGQPNIMSLLHHRSPAGRIGEALGLRTTIINSGSATLPLVFGALGSVVGTGAVFGTMAVLLGSGAASLRKRRK